MEKEKVMIQILFLSSPVLFGGLCLLMGETFHWARKRRGEKDLKKTTVFIHAGRE